MADRINELELHILKGIYFKNIILNKSNEQNIF